MSSFLKPSSPLKDGTVEVGPPKRDGETRVRRLAYKKDELVTQPSEGVDTVYDIVQYVVKNHGTKNGFGYRDVIDIIEEEKEVTKTVGGKEVKEMKKWKYFQLSDYKYLSYLEIEEAISEIARGFIDFGITTQDIVNIYASTSVNWQLVSFACCCISTSIATAYDSLGESGLQHSLNEPGCRAIFTNAELLPTVAKVAANVPSLKLVLYDGEAKADLVDKIKNAKEGGITVLTLDELRARGRNVDKETWKSRLPTPETVACIMYTSGTTGAPKGVVITHANLVATVGAVRYLLGHHFRHTDSYLAYLPLAHILEFVVELSLFYYGMPLGFGRVKTLTDQSVRNCAGDIRAFRPTIMTGVPAVWEMIRKGIIAKLNTSGKLKKTVFNGAMSIKRSGIPGLTQVADAAVLSQIRAATGGRLRLAMSGGAALSRETQEFLNLALVKMLQGYGLTETCGMCAVVPPEFFQYGVVGFIMPSVECKLVDVPEAGYLSTNNPPQGEMLIRGNSVIKGYYKRDDLNNDENIFTKDGWFRTGDVGQFNADGSISIIDRIKNLVKLSGGEYIALERLESVYKSCELVSNICVHASTDAKQPIAIIVPHEQHLRHALESAGIANVDAKGDLHGLCANPEVKALVMKACNALGKKNQFKTMELLEAVILDADEWTPQSGLVTAAQKVQRKKVAEKFDKQIKEIYSNQ